MSICEKIKNYFSNSCIMRNDHTVHEQGLEDLDKIKLTIPYIKNKVVLDIGSCNSGNPYVFRELRKYTKEIEGVDIDKKYTKILQEKGYNIIYGDAEKIESKKKYDVLTFFDLIEHTSNPGDFLKNIKKNLSQNGKIVFNTPNAYALNSFLVILMKGEFKIHPEHSMIFDESTLKQLLKRSGYKIEKAIHYTPIIKSGFITTIILKLTKLFGKFRKRLNNNILIVAKKI